MAIKLACDGCGYDLPVDTMPIGRLEPCYYCHDCRTTWERFEFEEQAERENVIAAYETWRRGKLATVRRVLKKVPDE